MFGPGSLAGTTIYLFADFFFACEREDGLPRLRLWRFAGESVDAAQAGEIAFPEPAYSAHPHINRIFETTTYRYAYQSLVTPSSVYEYEVAGGGSMLLKQVEVPGGFDRSLYASERVHATAADGVKVPVSLVYRKDKREAGKNPLYVYAYGSYGYSLPLGFNSNRLSLLDRGVAMAYAHIRGGGDLGKPWHDSGKMLVKRNTFTDFVAAVEHSTAAAYGDPKRVAIEGGSAGGLLMGAVTNLRPDLFEVRNDGKIDLVEVRWPTGKMETFKDVAGDKIYTIVEEQGIKDSVPLRDLAGHGP